jgi:hypothetical protein
VIHSLRHTMLTRLGEAGADAFTIMKIAGHSSVTVSQRYVHPTPEGLERRSSGLRALMRRSSNRPSLTLKRRRLAPGSLQKSLQSKTTEFPVPRKSLSSNVRALSSAVRAADS